LCVCVRVQGDPTRGHGLGLLGRERIHTTGTDALADGRIGIKRPAVIRVGRVLFYICIKLLTLDE